MTAWGGGEGRAEEEGNQKVPKGGKLKQTPQEPNSTTNEPIPGVAALALSLPLGFARNGLRGLAVQDDVCILNLVAL